VNPREAIVICMRGWSNDLSQEIFVLRRKKLHQDASELQECDFGEKSKWLGTEMVTTRALAFPPKKVSKRQGISGKLILAIIQSQAAYCISSRAQMTSNPKMTCLSINCEDGQIPRCYRGPGEKPVRQSKVSRSSKTRGQARSIHKVVA